jgi:DnaK suppressor protein
MKLHDDGYRIELEQKAEDLRQSLRHPGKTAAQRAPEKLEETLLAAERESATHDMERTYRLLRQVEVALARFQTGKYGSCLKCQREIPQKRLDAVPWAVYCVECQEDVDCLQARLNALRRPAA